MSAAQWQARIEYGGRVAGAGFLVTRDKVLTCAHVLRGAGSDKPEVSFPQLRGSGPVPARLVAHGGWAGHHTDAGDLAVLELDREVPIAPAALAPADAAHGDRKLVAYGFPAGYAEGTLAEYRTTAPVLISDEWIQLEAWSGYGQPLAAGFSGAAVTLVETGEVVGMVTAAAGAQGVRSGRMMPTHVMARHWSDLLALLPAPGPARAAWARLRALVEKADRAGPVCDPVRLYADAAGPFDPPAPPEGFGSLGAAASFVLCELDDSATVTRFTDRLEALLEAPLDAPVAAPGGPPDWSPILVELGPSGAGPGLVRVEVSAYSAGRRHPVASDTVAESRLRAYVQDRIEAAFRHLTPGADELIAFSLPRNWLDWPVDRWENEDATPLGCVHPVVVTDHGRRKASTRHLLTRAWQGLDACAGARVQRIGCAGAADPPRLRLQLRQSGACLAGFGPAPHAPRTRKHFETSLTAPAPVVMWSRRGCVSDEGCAEGCPGSAFLDALDAHVRQVAPGELPRSVLALREEADAEDGHWARDIQLLWDDPRCFTDPHAGAVHLRSPVA